MAALPKGGTENASPSEAQRQNIVFLFPRPAGQPATTRTTWLFCRRTGKLHGIKIGRNWVTTESDLDDFIKNYKNGISEVQDETGNKIPVHITHAAPEVIPQVENLVSANNLTLPLPTANSNDKTLFSVTAAQTISIPETSVPAPSIANEQSLGNANPAIQPLAIEPPHLELNKLKQSVFTDLEQRISKLDDSLEGLEREVQASAFQTKFLNNQQKKTLEQPVVIPVALPNIESRQPLHEKFASNFVFGEIFDKKPALLSDTSPLNRDNRKKTLRKFYPEKQN